MSSTEPTVEGTAALWRVAGLLAACLMLAGVFAPALELPGGSSSLWELSHGAALFPAIFAVATLLTALDGEAGGGAATAALGLVAICIMIGPGIEGVDLTSVGRFDAGVYLYLVGAGLAILAGAAANAGRLSDRRDRVG